MPPASQKESLVLIINIGVTNSNTESNDALVEKMKLIAKRRIENMIFLKPKNEVAIILMGSSVTRNKLDTEHVEEFAQFQVPNWNLIKKLMSLKSTKHCSNWVEALEATIEFIKSEVINTNTMKKIILMSDFNEESDIISQFEEDVIADRLSTEGIELITITEESLHDKPDTSLTISEALLKNVHKKTNSQHITFDDAISSLKFYVQPPSRPCPCYFNLELVDKQIPIACYVKVDIEKFPSWTMTKDGEKLEKKTVYLDRERKKYEKEDIIKGYKYGEPFIPTEKELERSMSYHSGEKSYRIHSFTSRNNIDLDYLYKSCSHVLLPSKEANSIMKPFYSLVQAMHTSNTVAIARKVGRKGSVPRMVALFPCIDIPDEPWCLVEIELAYEEDRRIMETGPMKSVIKQLSEEQDKAVDKLIDSMTLLDTDECSEIDGSQYFLPGCVPDPAMQYRWHALSHRALNPDKPLPPRDDYLEKILESPLIKEKSKCHLQTIAQLFRLESIERTSKKGGEQSKEEEEEDNTKVDDISVKKSDKVDEKIDADESCMEDPDLSMDTADIDLDELGENI